jgi:hypothetical protein
VGTITLSGPFTGGTSICQAGFSKRHWSGRSVLSKLVLGAATRSLDRKGTFASLLFQEKRCQCNASSPLSTVAPQLPDGGAEVVAIRSSCSDDKRLAKEMAGKRNLAAGLAVL